MNSIFIEYLKKIFYPLLCISCGKHGLLLCSDCYKQISIKNTSVCPLCGVLTSNFKYCTKCRKKSDIWLDSMAVLCDYSDPVVKDLIWKFKFIGFVPLGEIIASIMLPRLMLLSDKSSILVPVPISRKKEKKRGYNQTNIIANHLSDKSGFLNTNALKVIRETKDQVGLHRNDRKMNVFGKFQVVDSGYIAGKNIIIIDDVVTTGATINECARVLKKAGAKKVSAIVLAKNFQ